MSVSKIKFDEKGLIPVIAQDVNTDDVLMFAWMNHESFKRTLKNGVFVSMVSSIKKPAYLSASGLVLGLSSLSVFPPDLSWAESKSFSRYLRESISNYLRRRTSGKLKRHGVHCRCRMAESHSQ